MTLCGSIGGSALTDPTIRCSRIARDRSGRAGHLCSLPQCAFSRGGGELGGGAWEPDKVYIGAVEPDSSGYPDCRPAYYQAFNEVVRQGTKDGTIEIVTPLIAMRKAEIVTLGLELGAPLDLTWSCYSREDRACGVCDSCVLAAASISRRPGRKIRLSMWSMRQKSERDFRFSIAGDLLNRSGNLAIANRKSKILCLCREAKMRQRVAMSLLVALVVALCAVPAFAQATGSVKGVCKDMEGKPITDAVVEVDERRDRTQVHPQNQQARANISLSALAPGKYKVDLSKDGKEIYNFNGVTVSLDELTLDFDLKKEQATQAPGQGLTAEQVKQQQEAQAKVAKEQGTVKTLNDKLNAANEATTAGDFDTAIATLTEATQIDGTRDLLWFKLADAQRMSATKQTDPAEKQKRYEAAVQDYQKAIELQRAPRRGSEARSGSQRQDWRPTTTTSRRFIPSRTRSTTRSRPTPRLQNSIPRMAGQYKFNIGAVLTNAGKVDDAIAAFDKVIAADPTKADAYYWKGVNMIGKATLKGDKMVAPDGTAEAFQKYLELAPTGNYAEPAKQMLASIGATIETQLWQERRRSRSKALERQNPRDGPAAVPFCVQSVLRCSSVASSAVRHCQVFTLERVTKVAGLSELSLMSQTSVQFS